MSVIDADGRRLQLSLVNKRDVECFAFIIASHEVPFSAENEGL